MQTNERLNALAYYLDAVVREFTKQEFKLEKQQALKFAEDVWILVKQLEACSDGLIAIMKENSKASKND